MNDISDSEYDEPIPILLNRPQRLCAPQMFECLREYGHCVNGSPTGTGKTVLAYHMMQQLREYHQQPVYLVVVGPSSLEANKSGVGPLSSPWTREATKYNEDYMFVTYETVRGSIPTGRTASVVYDVRGGVKVAGLDPIYNCMSSPDEFEWYTSPSCDERKLYGAELDTSDPDPSLNIYTNYRGLVVRKDVRKTPSKKRVGPSPRIGGSPPATRPTAVKSNNNSVPPLVRAGPSRAKVVPKKSVSLPNTPIASPPAPASSLCSPKASFESTFSPSKWWMQFCVKNIVLFVVEEAHNGKNDSVQNNAVAALIRAVSRARLMRPDKASYVMYLTSTPMCKKSQAANYFKLLGLHNPVEGGDMFVGSGTRSPYDCYLTSRSYNPKRAVEIALEHKIIVARSNERYTKSGIYPANPAKIVFQFWLECILTEIQFAIVSMCPRQLWNGFFDVRDKADRRLFREAHRELQKARQLAESGDSPDAMRFMSSGHQKTDQAMVGPISDQIVKCLNGHPERRVVVAFKLIESVDRCIEILRQAGYTRADVGRIAGVNDSTSAEKKEASKNNALAIYNFQNDKIKVIVGTFSLMCTGLDLHDLIGNRPRWTYMSGNYDITVEQQLAGRTARFGSKSVPQIFICYPKQLGSEIQKIYASNVQKSMVMTETLGAIRREGLDDREMKFYKSIIRLPGDYDRYIELPSGCSDMSCLLDHPIYSMKTDSYTPESSSYGFIEYDDQEGRADYSDTSKMIAYLESICHTCEDITQVPGIVFSSHVPGTHDPTQSGRQTEQTEAEMEDPAQQQTETETQPEIEESTTL